MATASPNTTDTISNAAQPTRFWEDALPPQSSDEFAVMMALTIAAAARQGADELLLHTGRFRRRYTPQLNRLVRNRVYTALCALRAVQYDDNPEAARYLRALTAQHSRPPGLSVTEVALIAAVTSAADEFTELIYAEPRDALELTTDIFRGAYDDAIHPLMRLPNKPAMQRLLRTASHVPSYWELPVLEDGVAFG